MRNIKHTFLMNRSSHLLGVGGQQAMDQGLELDKANWLGHSTAHIVN